MSVSSNSNELDEILLDLVYGFLPNSELRYLEKTKPKQYQEVMEAKAKLEKLLADREKVTGETSDGYHTFNELYEFRLLYNATLFNELYKSPTLLAMETFPVKSWKHSDGEPCFGGGWFVVIAQLPTGQITNHYEAKDWDLFQIPEVPTAPEWDGHTAQDVAKRLRAFALSPTKSDGGEV